MLAHPVRIEFKDPCVIKLVEGKYTDYLNGLKKLVRVNTIKIECKLV